MMKKNHPEFNPIPIQIYRSMRDLSVGSSSSEVVFPPCNTYIIESILFLNIKCSVSLPSFQPPHNMRTQLRNVLCCHSDNSFSLICRKERAFSLIQMKAPSKLPEAKRGFAINVTGVSI